MSFVSCHFLSWSSEVMRVPKMRWYVYVYVLVTIIYIRASPKPKEAKIKSHSKKQYGVLLLLFGYVVKPSEATLRRTIGI